MKRAWLFFTCACALGCSSASFVVAAEDQQQQISDDAGVSGDVLELDSGAAELGTDAPPAETRRDTAADAPSPPFDSSMPDSAGVDAFDADAPSPPFDSSMPDSAGVDAFDTMPADTMPADTGCTLHDHYDPMYGTKWRSCLHSGVYGDPATYPPALVDEEFAHVDAAALSGCSWASSRTSLTCEGVTCIARSMTCPALFSGTGWSTWCAAGSLAGAFIGAAVSVAPSCPTKDSHGVWY